MRLSPRAVEGVEEVDSEAEDSEAVMEGEVMEEEVRMRSSREPVGVAASPG